MISRRLFPGLWLSVLCFAAAPPAFGLANRVFVSARSGNNANSCDNILTPCQTLAGAVAQLNPGGEAIVLDSGGYGPVTITQAVTIDAAPGVTAFIHPPAGDAITVNAGSGTVTLRGLILNAGNTGIKVNSVGTLNVENCFITGFAVDGVRMLSAGQLDMKGTNITACGFAVEIVNISGVVQASVDHCHMDGNAVGFVAGTTAPGSSVTTAVSSTANRNVVQGWTCGNGTTGQDVLNLEFCTGSGNGASGLFCDSSNALTAARYSNCVFANNSDYGALQIGAGTVATRGNNTITGNGSGTTSGTVPFSPL